MLGVESKILIMYRVYFDMLPAGGNLK